MGATLSELLPLRQGDLPLHSQAERAIRALLDHAAYASGGLLPDEMTLAKQLGISRGTVRTALAKLVSERRLERKAGVGTRVVPQSMESAVDAWRSFSREMQRRGIEVSMFHMALEDVVAPQDIADALHVKAGTVLQRLDRVRGWDQMPVLRSRSWFHPRVRFDTTETFVRPLYELVAAVSQITAERATESLDAAVATAGLAKELLVKRGAPLLRRQHTVYDGLDRPFEFAEIHYVSGRFTLTFDLKRESR